MAYPRILVSRFRCFRDISEFARHHLAAGGATSEKSLLRGVEAYLGGASQSVRDTYLACLNRLPETLTVAREYATAREAAAHILAVLDSDEFRRRGAQIVMNAYSEAPRLFFFHVPKTAGSRVTRHLESVEHVWNVAAEAPIWWKDKGRDLFWRNIARQAEAPDRRIVRLGHYSLADLRRTGLVRSRDRVFTVIRRPEDMILSAANYCLTLMSTMPERDDSQEWINWLDPLAREQVARGPEGVTAKVVESFVRSVGFRDAWSNNLVKYLGSDGSLTSAIENVTIFDIDVVDISNIDRFLVDSFGFNLSETYRNSSLKFIPSLEVLDRALVNYIKSALCPLDIVAYQMLRSEGVTPGGVIEAFGRDHRQRPLRRRPKGTSDETSKRAQDVSVSETGSASLAKSGRSTSNGSAKGVRAEGAGLDRVVSRARDARPGARNRSGHPRTRPA